mmetsp:Transcript_61538/g.127602  ORF Transcript_61538/g.127602 Transcript_61538/m.127602 type:complete len:88 (-) Transcript_61538:665-928(-)
MCHQVLQAQWPCSGLLPGTRREVPHRQRSKSQIIFLSSVIYAMTHRVLLYLWIIWSTPTFPNFAMHKTAGPLPGRSDKHRRLQPSPR